MESIAVITLVIFLGAVGLIIWGKWDRTVVGIVGAALMVVIMAGVGIVPLS